MDRPQEQKLKRGRFREVAITGGSSAVVAYVLQSTHNLVISRFCFPSKNYNERA